MCCGGRVDGESADTICAARGVLSRRHCLCHVIGVVCQLKDRLTAVCILTPIMTPRSLPNPILPGLNPDPTIVRVGTDYFICTSTFEYFPGLPIYHSRNLADWKLLGHALNRKSQLNMRTVESGGGIFAPSLRHHKGRFYLSCCACYRVPNFENLHKVGFTFPDRAHADRFTGTGGPPGLLCLD